jgi:hypothetical protein
LEAMKVQWRRSMSSSRTKIVLFWRVKQGGAQVGEVYWCRGRWYWKVRPLEVHRAENILINPRMSNLKHYQSMFLFCTILWYFCFPVFAALRIICLLLLDIIITFLLTNSMIFGDDWNAVLALKVIRKWLLSIA